MIAIKMIIIQGFFKIFCHSRFNMITAAPSLHYCYYKRGFCLLKSLVIIFTFLIKVNHLLNSGHFYFLYNRSFFC